MSLYYVNKRKEDGGIFREVSLFFVRISRRTFFDGFKEGPGTCTRTFLKTVFLINRNILSKCYGCLLFHVGLSCASKEKSEAHDKPLIIEIFRVVFYDSP